VLPKSTLRQLAAKAAAGGLDVDPTGLLQACGAHARRVWAAEQPAPPCSPVRARGEQVAPIQHQAGIGRAFKLVWPGACCARRKCSPNPAYSDSKRVSRCSHVTLSTTQPLPAYSRRLVSLQAACFFQPEAQPEAFNQLLKARIRMTRPPKRHGMDANMI
jgi:hypothetical protein